MANGKKNITYKRNPYSMSMGPQKGDIFTQDGGTFIQGSWGGTPIEDHQSRLANVKGIGTPTSTGLGKISPVSGHGSVIGTGDIDFDDPEQVKNIQRALVEGGYLNPTYEGKDGQTLDSIDAQWGRGTEEAYRKAIADRRSAQGLETYSYTDTDSGSGVKNMDLLSSAAEEDGIIGETNLPGDNGAAIETDTTEYTEDMDDASTTPAPGIDPNNPPKGMVYDPVSKNYVPMVAPAEADSVLQGKPEEKQGWFGSMWDSIWN